VAGTTVMVLSDLATDGELVYFGKAASATVPFTMTVRNLGNWPSSGGRSRCSTPCRQGRRAFAAEGGAPGDRTRPRGGDWGPPQPGGPACCNRRTIGIYIQLDPDGIVDESNENNNLVAAGEVLVGDSGQNTYRTYLPLVTR